jgi:hypothetical protein
MGLSIRASANQSGAGIACSPLELRSNSPEMVTAWLTNKVPFHFQLPSAASDPSRAPAYRLTGASMVNFQGSPTAIVTHENRTRKLPCWLRQASLPSCMAGMKSVSAL